MKLPFDRTTLQVIEFGNEPDDKFYCLINLNVSPDGMNVDKLRLTDPRNFDLQFRESGCLLMFTGDEIEELVRRKDVDRNSMHESLYRLARKEGILK